MTPRQYNDSASAATAAATTAATAAATAAKAATEAVSTAAKAAADAVAIAAATASTTATATAALETKIEVLRVQMVAVETKVTESISESRHWHEESRVEKTVDRKDMESRFDKHEASDDHRHALIETAIARLENETLDAGKMMVKRVEFIEQVLAARPMVQERLTAVELDLARRPTPQDMESRLTAVDRDLALVTTIPPLAARVENLEKAKVADDAVQGYKRWLVTAVLVGGASLLLNAIRLFEPVFLSLIRAGATGP